jgi:hypothetical protein
MDDMPKKIIPDYASRPPRIFAIARKYWGKNLHEVVVSAPAHSAQAGGALLHAAGELCLFDGSNGWAITLYMLPEVLWKFEDFQVFASAMKARVELSHEWFLSVAAESRGGHYYTDSEYRHHIEPLNRRLNRALQTIERHRAKCSELQIPLPPEKEEV